MMYLIGERLLANFRCLLIPKKLLKFTTLKEKKPLRWRNFSKFVDLENQ